MARVLGSMWVLLMIVGCASKSVDPTTSTGRITSDPVAAVKAALPDGWRIYRVEDNSFPFYHRSGNGKAIRLVMNNRSVQDRDYDAIVYIMPPDYDDGGKDFTRGDTQTTPPTLAATTANGKIYLWGTPEDWPTMHDDLLIALLK